MLFLYRYSTEVFFVRIVQALQFFLCYSCTRSLVSNRQWENSETISNISDSGTDSSNNMPLVLGFVGCFCVIVYVLLVAIPRVVPLAFLVMAMPP